MGSFNATLTYWSLLPAFEQHTVPVSTEFPMHSGSPQVHALGPVHCTSWLKSQEFRGHALWGCQHPWREDMENLAFSQPKFLPTALLNNLERILTPLKLAASAQQSFLKSHIPPQLEVKNVLFFFLRQNKYSLELLFYPRIQDRRKCSGWFFYPAVEQTELLSAVLLLSGSWLNNWEQDSKALSFGWVQSSVRTRCGVRQLCIPTTAGSCNPPSFPQLLPKETETGRGSENRKAKSRSTARSHKHVQSCFLSTPRSKEREITTLRWTRNSYALVFCDQQDHQSDSLQDDMVALGTKLKNVGIYPRICSHVNLLTPIILKVMKALLVFTFADKWLPGIMLSLCFLFILYKLKDFLNLSEIVYLESNNFIINFLHKNL